MTASVKPPALALLLPILAAAAGCTSLKPINPKPEMTLADTIRQEASVAVGDVVEITRRDGRRIQGKVLRVDAETIMLENGPGCKDRQRGCTACKESQRQSDRCGGSTGWLVIVLVTASVTFMQTIGVL